MNHDGTLTRLLTSKTDLSSSKIDTLTLAPLKEGEVILKVERVAVTTNNITYAALGEVMQYWGFFPTYLEGWGQMPAWGLADVVASSVRGVEIGERFYGYFPMGSHLRVQPARCSSRGFYDSAPHRVALTSAYNHYTRCSTDPVYDKSLENHQVLLRPLILTSFYAADFLQDNDFFGAERLVFSSASSKTAYGTAFSLEGSWGVELVGLTSARNRSFVEGLACYHRVVTYEELEGLSRDTHTTYVDYSGDPALRARVHRHFGSALVYDCLAGAAQNTKPDQGRKQEGLPGPAPKLYFAPTQIAKRNEEWGHDEVNRRFGNAQRAFIARVADPASPWMEVVEHRGFDAAASLLTDMVAGRIDPRVGHVVLT